MTLISQIGGMIMLVSQLIGPIGFECQVPFQQDPGTISRISPTIISRFSETMVGNVECARLQGDIEVSFRTFATGAQELSCTDQNAIDLVGQQPILLCCDEDEEVELDTCELFNITFANLNCFWNPSTRQIECSGFVFFQWRCDCISIKDE